MIRLSKIVKEGEEPKRFSNEVKKHFLEIVSTYNKYQEMMDRKSDITEVAETLGGITDAARELAVNEADDWFDAHTVKRNMNELTKLGKSFDQVAIEAKNLDQRLHGLYEDMGHILSRYYKMGEITEDQMKERLGLREAIGNDKAMLALVDMLSNSMEHYASANEFVNITSKIPGFANYKSELKDVFAKYWKVGARERNDWHTKDWLKWLKQWPLEEAINEKNPGLWANINAKKARGEKSSPKNSQAYKDAVEAGKKINNEVSVNEEAKPILKPGTKVKLRGGKSGKIVRFDGKTPGSPFYIVDIGQYYSIEVPAYELETESVKEAAYGYKDSTASYIDKHKEEFKAAEKMNKGNEQSFYDSLSTLEEKLGHPKYMIFLSNALRGYKVDMYKDPKIKNQQEAEEALFLLSK